MTSYTPHPPGKRADAYIARSNPSPNLSKKRDIYKAMAAAHPPLPRKKINKKGVPQDRLAPTSKHATMPGSAKPLPYDPSYFPSYDVIEVSYKRSNSYQDTRYSYAIPTPHGSYMAPDINGVPHRSQPQVPPVPPSVIEALTKQMGFEIERYQRDMMYNNQASWASTSTSSSANYNIATNWTATSNNTSTSMAPYSNNQWITSDDYYYSGDPARRAAPPKEFNKFINASDLMEDFIKYLGEENVRQGDAMGMPIELFIKWLIIRACEADQETPNVVLELPAPQEQARCLGCQRYMKSAPVMLHNERCAGFHFKRQALSAAA